MNIIRFLKDGHLIVLFLFFLKFRLPIQHDLFPFANMRSRSQIRQTTRATFRIHTIRQPVAALMYCAQYHTVTTTMGSMLGLKAFVAAVMGGIGLIPGAMLGGIVVGIIEALVTAYISSSLANAVVFLILIVMLLVKPAGILGKNVGEKV